MGQVNMRLSTLDQERLDRLAERSGVTRSEVVRRLLAAADDAPQPEPPDRDELLRLLGEMARHGSCRAAETLLRRLDRQHAGEDLLAELNIR